MIHDKCDYVCEAAAEALDELEEKSDRGKQQ
jgi:hypothetical protein